MPKDSTGKSRRVLQIGGLLSGLAVLWLLWAVLLEALGFELFFCVFHKATGLYCPGCGAMRALASLMQLDFYQALRFNGLFVIVLPVLLLALVREAVCYVRDGKTPSPGKWDKPMAVIAIVLAIFFGVARNLPALSILAPTVVS